MGVTDSARAGIATSTSYTVGSAKSATVVIADNDTAGDIVSPTVSLTNPADGATVSNNVVIRATASDNIAVRKVEFMVAGDTVGVATTSPYTYVWDTTEVANGTRAIRAVATDTSGNRATSTRSVTVSNISQSCTLGGVTVPEGSTRVFYKAPQSPNCNATLNNNDQKNAHERTCTNGKLSGPPEFNKKSCTNIAYSLQSVTDFLRPVDVWSTDRLKGGNEIHTFYPFGHETAEPRWHIGQWYSKYPIETASPTKLPNGSVEYKNPGKRLVFGPGNKVIIGVNATVDRGPRILPNGTKDGDRIKSFLAVTQPNDVKEGEALITELDSMRFMFTGRLTKLIDKTNGRQGRASFNATFVITNRNPSSPGYKDSMYFLMPVYVTDQLVQEKKMSIDPGTGKVLYKFDASEFGLTPKRNYSLTLPGKSLGGEFITVNKEVLPLLITAIHDIYKKRDTLENRLTPGVLAVPKWSDNPADYTVTKEIHPPHWETQDPIDIEFEYKDLDFVLKRKQPTATVPLTAPAYVAPLIDEPPFVESDIDDAPGNTSSSNEVSNLAAAGESSPGIFQRFMRWLLGLFS